MTVRLSHSKGFKLARDVIVFLVFLTASFDLFLAFDIEGFTIRLTQLLTVALYAFAFFDVLQSKKLVSFEGLGWLCGFAIINILFTFNTILPKWNILYDLWLISLLAMAVSIRQLYRDEWETLLTLYLWSFVIMAVFGIIQFVYGITEISTWMISQTWMGIIPRVNGFTYEPSYYGTYMIVGWCICGYLIQSRITKFRGLRVIPMYLLISLALVLCSSRIALVMMLLVSGSIILVNVIQFFRDRKVNQWRVSIILLQICSCLLIFLYSQWSNWYISDYVTANVLLTDVTEQGNESVGYRLQAWGQTWKVFLRSPILGCGLGGVNAEVGAISGATVEEILASGRGGSGNIVLEILAATGIFGFLCIAMYVVKVIFHLFKSNAVDDRSRFLQAVFLAFVCQCALLVLNQNILRIYFWNTIAVMTVLLGDPVPYGKRTVGKDRATI